jgi:hypothetical protein
MGGISPHQCCHLPLGGVLRLSAQGFAFLFGALQNGGCLPARLLGDLDGPVLRASDHIRSESFRISEDCRHSLLGQNVVLGRRLGCVTIPSPEQVRARTR